MKHSFITIILLLGISTSAVFAQASNTTSTQSDTKMIEGTLTASEKQSLIDMYKMLHQQHESRVELKSALSSDLFAQNFRDGSNNNSSRNNRNFVVMHRNSDLPPIISRTQWVAEDYELSLPELQFTRVLLNNSYKLQANSNTSRSTADTNALISEYAKLDVSIINASQKAYNASSNNDLKDLYLMIQSRNIQDLYRTSTLMLANGITIDNTISNLLNKTNSSLVAYDYDKVAALRDSHFYRNDRYFDNDRRRNGKSNNRNNKNNYR